MKSYYEVNIYDNDGIDQIEGLDAEQYARIDMIFVAPEERGQGKGRELLANAIEEAKATGLEVYLVAMDCEEDTNIERLCQWYESEGFDVVAAIGDGVLMRY